MLVISNNCVGGWIYSELKEKYNNPFIWCEIDEKDFLYLVNNFEDIDFTKRELIKVKMEKYQERDVFAIKIDDCIVIPFPHHVKNENFKTPTKCESNYIGWDLCYEKIEDYILKKYDERVDRMKEVYETPIFVIDTSIMSKKITQEIEVFNCEKILCIYKHNYEPLKLETKTVYISELATKGRALKIIEKYSDYIRNGK